MTLNTPVLFTPKFILMGAYFSPNQYSGSYIACMLLYILIQKLEEGQMCMSSKLEMLT